MEERGNTPCMSKIAASTFVNLKLTKPIVSDKYLRTRRYVVAMGTLMDIRNI